MAGVDTSSSIGLATYTIDDSANTFSESSYSAAASQLNYSGTVTSYARGLRGLNVSYLYGSYCSGDCGIDENVSTVPSSYEIALAGQAGGLVYLDYSFPYKVQSGSEETIQATGFSPIVAAQSCPAFATPESFLFVTTPATLAVSSPTFASAVQWYPLYDTAYGTVKIGGSDTAINFSGIQQFAIDGTQLQSYQSLSGNPAAVSSITGACSSTFYGNTVSVPGTLTINNPGLKETITPAAILGIGPSGLLVESNGNGTAYNTNSSPLYGYQPFLGAGTGAIGLPQPASAVDASSLLGAQYLGIIFSAGAPNPSGDGIVGLSSSIASFGFSSQPSSCANAFGGVQPGSSSIYGQDFHYDPSNPSDPNNPGGAVVQANGGFGTNCDFNITLGAQDASTNGLFPKATVFVGSTYSGNTTGNAYSFPATAIAGQLNGKFAIFLIGVDTTGSPNQAWGIYLLQSN
jgi:hypothetical protein